jgi:hypothetical protein
VLSRRGQPSPSGGTSPREGVRNAHRICETVAGSSSGRVRVLEVELVGVFEAAGMVAAARRRPAGRRRHRRRLYRDLGWGWGRPMAPARWPGRQRSRSGPGSASAWRCCRAPVRIGRRDGSQRSGLRGAGGPIGTARRARRARGAPAVVVAVAGLAGRRPVPGCGRVPLGSPRYRSGMCHIQSLGDIVHQLRYPSASSASAVSAASSCSASPVAGGVASSGRTSTQSGLGPGRVTVPGSGRSGFRVPDFDPALTVPAAASSRSRNALRLTGQATAPGSARACETAGRAAGALHQTDAPATIWLACRRVFEPA